MTLFCVLIVYVTSFLLWTCKYGHMMLFSYEWIWYSPYWILSSPIQMLRNPELLRSLPCAAKCHSLAWSWAMFLGVLFPPSFTVKLDGIVWNKPLNEWHFLHSQEALLLQWNPFQVQEKMGVGGLYGLCGCSFFVINSNSWKCSHKLWLQKTVWMTKEVFVWDFLTKALVPWFMPPGSCLNWNWQLTTSVFAISPEITSKYFYCFIGLN